MPQKVWILYRLFRRADGLGYIGQTRTTLDLRRARHIRAAWERGQRSPLHEAIRSSGDEAFKVWAIEPLACCTSQRDADELEAALIAQEGTLHPAGFNGVPYRYRGTVDEKAQARERNRLAKQRQAAARERIFALDDAGHLARDIATAVGLGYGHVTAILRRAGRVAPGRDQREKRGVKAFIAQHHARTAPMLERAAAMEKEGAGLADIGAAIGLTMSGAHMLLKRARQDGRLPPRPHKPMVRNKIAARARKAASLIEANLSRRELAEALGVSYRSIYLTLRRLDIRPSRQKPSAESEQRRIAAVRAVGSVKAAATRERVLALDDAGHSRVEIAVTLGLSTKHVAALLCAAGRKVTEAERIARRWPQYQGRTAADPRQGELPL